MAAPLGNNNATKNRQWANALQRAITQDDGARLRKAAEQLLDLAASGEQWAVKELADRLDGRSIQGVEVSGKDGAPFVLHLSNTDAEL
jgi:hypothetical protein